MTEMPRKPERSGQPHQVWTIYEKPKDFPGHYVLRVSLLRDGQVLPLPVCLLFFRLEDAREAIPNGLMNFGRSDGDDPSIKEVWI